MNIGAKSGLVDPKHEESMGQSVWLYLWFLWRQTKSSGLVLGGKPLTYKSISQSSGFSERKIRRWLQILKFHGYVQVEYRNYMMMAIRILKSKKFNYKQQALPLTENGQGVIPKVVKGYTKSGQPKQSGTMREIQSKEAEEPPTADRHLVRMIFEEIKSEPFGDVKFQNIFTREATNGAKNWVEAMEHTIVSCRASGVTVPGRFYTIKRVLEKSEAEYSFKRTPL